MIDRVFLEGAIVIAVPAYFMPKPSEVDIAEEQIHFQNVVATFEQYASYSVSPAQLFSIKCIVTRSNPRKLAANNRRRKDLFSLSTADQQILEALGWKEKLVEIDKAILANAQFIKQMVAEPGSIFSESDEEEGSDDTPTGSPVGQSMYMNGLIFFYRSHTYPSHYYLEFTQSNTKAPRSASHTHSHEHPHEHSHDHTSPVSSKSKHNYRPTDFDMDKLRSTIKQFVRDWSEEVCRTMA